MNKKRTISVAQPHFPEENQKELLDDIKGILNGKLTKGPFVDEFESKFADFTGTKYSVAVHSATNALEVILRYFDVEGKEVIVPTETFIATANAVQLAGGNPVFADINKDSLTLDLETVRPKVTEATTGIIFVPLFGYLPEEIYKLRQFARKNDLFLLEDAAQAHGARLNGNKAGTVGDAGCFSMYATKIMTTGEGGIITTDDKELVEFAKSFRNHGMALDKEECIRVGSNYRMDEIRAAMGISQLDEIDNFITQRNSIAQFYSEQLKSFPLATIPQKSKKGLHSYWKYPLILDETVDRDCLVDHLGDKGIEVSVPYKPLGHRQPYYADLLDSGEEFPVAEKVMEKLVTLPIHPKLSKSDAQYVVHHLKEQINEVAKI